MTTRLSGERGDNLPAAGTRSTGRKQEMASIAKAIGAHRLVTLWGPGGVGKTRLALQVVASVRGAFSQGAWLAELSAVREPGLVPAEVAKVLGLPDEAGDGAESLARQVAEAEILLILDACEHLIMACARLAGTLLDNCPDLRILATSREPLGIAGEHVLLISPLEVPQSADAAIATAGGGARPALPGGPKPLTRREREIAGLVAQGLGNRQIAERLFLSKRTVDSHIEHIFAKLGFTSRTQLGGWMRAEGQG